MVVLFSILCSLTIIYTYGKKNIYQDDQLKICESLSREYKDICLYNTAIEIVYINVSKSLFICSNIKDKYNSGRCYSDIISIIVNNSKSKINESLIICKNIKHPFWESECYFNVAESLYMNFPRLSLYFNKSKINLALNICEESKLLKNNCYSHVLWNLNPTQTSEVCKYRFKKYKNNCYYFLGVHLAVDIYLPKNRYKCLKNFSECYSEAFIFCQSIEEECRRYCNLGLWAGLDYSNLLNICKSVNKTYKKDCYYSLGVVIGQIEINPLHISCENVREEYKIDCYGGFWKVIRQQENPKICEPYSEAYKERCYEIFNECFEIDGTICCEMPSFAIVCKLKID